MHLRRNGLQGLQSMQSQICCISSQRKDRKCNSCVLGRWNLFSSTLAKHGVVSAWTLATDFQKKSFQGGKGVAYLVCYVHADHIHVPSQHPLTLQGPTCIYRDRVDLQVFIGASYRPHCPQAPIEVVKVVHFGAMPFTFQIHAVVKQKLTKTDWYSWSAHRCLQETKFGRGCGSGANSFRNGSEWPTVRSKHSKHSKLQTTQININNFNSFKSYLSPFGSALLSELKVVQVAALGVCPGTSFCTAIQHWFYFGTNGFVWKCWVNIPNEIAIW